MVVMKIEDSETPFIWTRGQIDQFNQWTSEKTTELNMILNQLRIFHDHLFGDNAHPTSPECPLCRDRVAKKEKAEAEILRKRLDKERDASDIVRSKAAI